MRTVDLLREDALAYSRNRSSSLFRALRHPGFRVGLWWRVAIDLQSKRLPGLPQLLRQRLIKSYACDLHLNVVVGGGLRMPHPIGIVVGQGTSIGRRVTLMQHATLGGNRDTVVDGRMTPVLGDDVTIGPGAGVFGPVELPAGRFVGANTVTASPSS